MVNTHPEGPRVAVETDAEQLGGQGKEPSHTTAAATPEHRVVGSLGPSWARLWYQDEGVWGAKTGNQAETWSWVKKGCPGLGSAFNSANFQDWLSDGQVGTGQGLSTSPGGS